MSFYQGPLYSSFLRLVLSGILLLCSISCKKFIEGVGPPITEIVGTTVYANDLNATAVVTGIYSRMVSNYYFASGGFNSVTFLASLSADELTNYSVTIMSQRQFYENALLSTNGNIRDGLWNTMYQFIYSANALLEGLENSKDVTAATKAQLQGEAKFIRAFCYFYLVGLFGNVPLVMTTDHDKNAKIARSPSSQVYEQIISDLQIAQKKLSDAYNSFERARPNKWAATALLARVYLYKGDWVNAEAQATDVINNSMYKLDGLDSVFLMNSREAIWQLKPIQLGMNTQEALLLILTGPPNIGGPFQSTALSDHLLNAFVTGDKRKGSWIDSIEAGGKTYYFPHKYKATTPPTKEYSMVLRLAEQYLIRSEAAARQNKTAQARADLDVIRKRAGLPRTPARTRAALLQAIERERQVELFTEWGHRWLDLKRTERANVLLSAIKADWQLTDVLYPIPEDDIRRNPNMTQNPGYE